MSRGVRKSVLEKKMAELNEMRESIAAHENALDVMREKESQLLEEIELEEVKKLNEALKANKISIDDVLSIINNSKKDII